MNWLALAAVPAAAVALLPLAYLGIRAFEEGPGTAWATVARPRTLELAGNTLLLAAAVTGTCLVLGVAAAWVLVRSTLPLRRLWLTLLLMPLAIPSYVAGLAWIASFPGLEGFPGAWLVLSTSNLPFVLLPVAAALRTADPALEEVSRSLGRGSAATFRRVTLPRILPAATAGGLLVALYVLHDFGAVGLLRYETFTRGIEAAYNTIDRTTAAVLGLLLVALALVFTGAESWSRGRATHRLGSGAARAATPVRLGWWGVPVTAVLAVLAGVSVGLPLWVLSGYARSATPGFLPDLLDATGNTLMFSVLGALCCAVLALPVGILAARRRTLGVRGLELAAFAGHALPGITVGLALVYFGIRVARPWYQETPLLVVAYAVLFLPIAISAVRTAVAGAPPVLEDVGRSLGRGRFAVLTRITIPLAAPGTIAGVALVFLTCAKELPATLLLRPIGSDTLATGLWTHANSLAYGDAAVYGVALVLLSALPAVLLEAALRRGHGAREGTT